MLGRGVGVNAMTVAVCTALGPTVAAGILHVATWPLLFAVNVPLGLVAVALALARGARVQPPQRRRWCWLRDCPRSCRWVWRGLQSRPWACRSISLSWERRYWQFPS